MAMDSSQQQRLDDALVQSSKCKSLSLFLHTGDPFPLEIMSLTQLESLELSFGSFKELPTGFGVLDRLRELKITYCGLCGLPQTLAKCKQLHVLTLTGNAIRDVPDSIAKLTELQELDLSHNSLVSVPASIPRLKHLRKLRLESNLLFEIPRPVLEMPDLEITYQQNPVSTYASNMLLHRRKPPTANAWGYCEVSREGTMQLQWVGSYSVMHEWLKDRFEVELGGRSDVFKCVRWVLNASRFKRMPNAEARMEINKALGYERFPWWGTMRELVNGKDKIHKKIQEIAV
jgi:hypothetical protein